MDLSFYPPADTPPIYAQDGLLYDAVVHAHYFAGSCDWWVTEYDPYDPADPARPVGYGYACLGGDTDCAEFGYIDIGELERMTIPVVVSRKLSPVPYHPRHFRTVVAHQAIEKEADWQPRTLRECLTAKGYPVREAVKA